MTTMIEGKSLKEAAELGKNFIHLVTDNGTSETVRTKAGKLKIFEGVKQFPVRVKCATLIWHTLADALKDKGGSYDHR